MADPISPIAAGSIRPIAPVGVEKPAEGPAFVDTLKNLVGEVDQAQRTAEEAARAYATGKTTDVTSTMLSMERASITLALMLQVRSRLLEAYQEIQRMQV
jgi:flagellar hook-basal body complex protein FliE